MSVTPDNSGRMQAIRQRLEESLAPSQLKVRDDSHKHVGHAGARDGRGHFAVSIVSERFSGMLPVARHRAVYQALGELMQTDIHALQIRALSPAEAAELPDAD